MKQTNSLKLAEADFSAALDHHVSAAIAVADQALSEHQQARVQVAGKLNALNHWLHERFSSFVHIIEISGELNKGVLAEDILTRIYTVFDDIIPYDRIGCALLDDSGTKLTAFWAQTSYTAKPQINKGYTARLKGSSLEQVIRTGQPRIINDLEAYLAEHPNSDSTKRIVAEGIRSSLTCPLIAEGKAVGMLFFSSREKNTYQDLHQDTFLFLASQVAHLIEKSRLYQRILDLNERLQEANQQLKDKASRDPLTGMLNRGAILDFLNEKIQQSDVNSTGLLMVDIDHFKAVNDNYGHLNGDLVLRKVTEIMLQSIRPSDRIGRYGGEEFIAVLSNVNAAQLNEIAERIRIATANQEIALDTGSIQVTISIGGCLLAEVVPANKHDFIELADKRLYRAKETGRNRTIVDG